MLGPTGTEFIGNPFICGGLSYDGVISGCWSFLPDGEVTETAQMSTPRMLAAGIGIGPQFFVIGGFSDESGIRLDSTEFIAPEQVGFSRSTFMFSILVVNVMI